MTETETVNAFKSYVDAEIGRCEDILSRFERDLEKSDRDPADTFAWGSDAVRAAARFRVFSAIFKGLVEGKTSFSVMIGLILDEEVRMGKHMPSSTDPMQNLVRHYEAQTYLDIYSDWKTSLSK